MTDRVPKTLEALKLLSVAQVAELLGVSQRQLRRLVQSGQFPHRDIVLGRSPRWRVATIEAFVAGRWQSRQTRVAGL